MSYQVYKVGGAVRDELLGKAVKDIDWVIVGATSNLLLSEGYLQVGKDFPVFLHPKTKEEYALARTERKQGHGYSGFEVFATPDVTLEEDLLRRDLTINAMAMDEHGNIVDPYNGQKDLENRVLRHVSAAFEEDPLRVLRLARFYARFYDEGFTIADETKTLVRKMVDSGELSHLVAERIWLETHKALNEQHAVQYFIVLKDLNALAAIFPRIAHCFENDREKLQIAFDCVAEAVMQSQAMHIRVALLMTMFDSVDDVKRFAKDYRLSVLERVAAEKLYSWKSWFNTKHDMAEPWLELFMGLDAFRKPDQMEDFLSCMEILMKINGDVVEFLVMKNQLLKIFNELSCVDIKSIIINVLPKEIPVKIKEYRLNVIKKMIKY